jgi:hypothetical protein
MTWRLIKLEDTADWPADGALRTRGIRTWSHYCFDDESRTFCCEITPSRTLWYIGFTWDLAEGAEPLADEENERWHDFVMEHGRPDDNVRYYHCDVADRMPYEDVTMHIDEETREHLFACEGGAEGGADCPCEQQAADQIREWAVTGEIT